MDSNKEYWDKEMEKCNASPYYFFTTYFQINGEPATTHLTEEEFNKQFNELKDGIEQRKNRRRY